MVIEAKKHPIIDQPYSPDIQDNQHPFYTIRHPIPNNPHKWNDIFHKSCNKGDHEYALDNMEWVKYSIRIKAK